MNLRPAEIVDGHAVAGPVWIPTGIVLLGPIVLGIRPSDLWPGPCELPSPTVEVRDVRRLGSGQELRVLWEGPGPLTAVLDDRTLVHSGERMRLTVEPHRIHLFHAESGRRLVPRP